MKVSHRRVCDTPIGSLLEPSVERHAAQELYDRIIPQVPGLIRRLGRRRFDGTSIKDRKKNSTRPHINMTATVTASPSSSQRAQGRDDVLHLSAAFLAKLMNAL